MDCLRGSKWILTPYGLSFSLLNLSIPIVRLPDIASKKRYIYSFLLRVSLFYIWHLAGESGIGVENRQKVTSLLNSAKVS